MLIRRLLRVSGWSLGVLGVIACKAADDRSAPESFVDDFCQIVRSCCASRSEPPDDGAACRTTLGLRMADQSYDQAKASACLDGLRAEGRDHTSTSCDQFAPAVCEDVLASFRSGPYGLKTGDACHDDAECASSAEGDVRCPWRGASPSVCEVDLRGKEGDACSATKDDSLPLPKPDDPLRFVYCDVADGLRCSESGARTCERMNEIGAPCAVADSLSCVKAATCDATTKTCTARTPLGGDCTRLPCVSEAYCDRATKTCLERKPRGTPCDSDECVVGYSCSGSPGPLSCGGIGFPGPWFFGYCRR